MTTAVKKYLFLALLTVTATVTVLACIILNSTRYLSVLLDGSGTQEDPYVLIENSIHLPYVGEGESVYFVYTPSREGFIEIKAEGAVITVMDTVSGYRVQFKGGLMCPVHPGQMVEIQVFHVDPDTSGEILFDFTDENDCLHDSEGRPIDGSGTKDDPYILIQSGKLEPSVNKGEEKYFEYTATEDSKIVIEIPGGTIEVTLPGGTVATGTDRVLVDVKDGETVDIKVSYTNPDAEGRMDMTFTDAAHYKAQHAVDITVINQRRVNGQPVDADNVPLGGMPGQTIPQVVSVANANGEAYVRMRWDATITDANGNEMPHTREQLEELIRMDYGDSWDYNDNDGWWYYRYTVKAGETSLPLYTSYTLDGERMTNEYMNCEINISHIAQGVQVADNGDNPLAARGWPVN